MHECEYAHNEKRRKSVLNHGKCVCANTVTAVGMHGYQGPVGYDHCLLNTVWMTYLHTCDSEWVHVVVPCLLSDIEYSWY